MAPFVYFIFELIVDLGSTKEFGDHFVMLDYA